MPKFRDRECPGCGAIEKTASRSEICKLCFLAERKEQCKREEESLLTQLGYEEISFAGYDLHGHRLWNFKHECGIHQQWVIGNIFKRIREDAESTPCSHCGGKRRTKNATAKSADNRRVKNPSGWIRYRKQVRDITEANYILHFNEINPLNLPRNMYDYHLDHRVSIIDGYEKGIPPEVIGGKDNLRMLTAFDNLSKGRKSDDVQT